MGDLGFREAIRFFRVELREVVEADVIEADVPRELGYDLSELAKADK